jgi:hypothetical protein
MNPLPQSIARSVTAASIEFAGTKFKSKAITGLDYIKHVENDYLESTINYLPAL